MRVCKAVLGMILFILLLWVGVVKGRWFIGLEEWWIDFFKKGKENFYEKEKLMLEWCKK